MNTQQQQTISFVMNSTEATTKIGWGIPNENNNKKHSKHGRASETEKKTYIHNSWNPDERNPI